MNKYIELYNATYKTHVYILQDYIDRNGLIVGTIIHTIYNEREKHCCDGYRGWFAAHMSKPVTDQKIISMLDKMVIFK